MKSLQKKLVFSALLAILPFTSQAESASSPVDSWVGLESPFRVICTSLNFGVWFVPTGDRGGSTTISIDTKSGTTDTGVTISGPGSDRLAVIADRGYDSPLAGVCNVKGSLAENGQALEITFESSSNENISLIPSEHIYAQGLKQAPIGASLNVSLRAPESGRTTVALTNGEAQFRVVGDLTIPNNILRNNYGAYKSERSATIIVSDGYVN